MILNVEDSSSMTFFNEKSAMHIFSQKLYFKICVAVRQMTTKGQMILDFLLLMIDVHWNCFSTIAKVHSFDIFEDVPKI